MRAASFLRWDLDLLCRRLWWGWDPRSRQVWEQGLVLGRAPPHALGPQNPVHKIFPSLYPNHGWPGV